MNSEPAIEVFKKYSQADINAIRYNYLSAIGGCLDYKQSRIREEVALKWYSYLLCADFGLNPEIFNGVHALFAKRKNDYYSYLKRACLHVFQRVCITYNQNLVWEDSIIKDCLDTSSKLYNERNLIGHWNYLLHCLLYDKNGNLYMQLKKECYDLRIDTAPLLTALELMYNGYLKENEIITVLTNLSNYWRNYDTQRNYLLNHSINIPVTTNDGTPDKHRINYDSYAQVTSLILMLSHNTEILSMGISMKDINSVCQNAIKQPGFTRALDGLLTSKYYAALETNFCIHNIIQNQAWGN